jgi:hypothetical protein
MNNNANNANNNNDEFNAMNRPRTLTQEQINTIVNEGENVVEIPDAEIKVKRLLNLQFNHDYETYLSKNNLPKTKDISEAISELLINNNAIIAGGFLHAVLNLKTTTDDIDIYVPCKNLSNINADIPNYCGKTSVGEAKSSVYCLSFLKKNGIRSVQTFQKYRTRLNIQIMAVRNRKSPIDVVKNFDLTFCQVWYDGKKVYTTHINHLMNKVGLLQKEYVPLFVNGNTFLHNRVKKYRKVGFRIVLDPLGLDMVKNTPTDVFKMRGYSEKVYVCKQGEDSKLKDKWTFSTLYTFIKSSRYDSTSTGCLLKSPNKTYFSGVERNRYFEKNKVGSSDGYDSEDFDTQQPKELFKLAKEHANDERKELPDESCFYLAARDLIANMQSDKIRKNPYLNRIFYVDGRSIEEINQMQRDKIDYIQEILDVKNRFSIIQYWLPYIQLLETFANREGDDFFGGEGKLYDFHAHPLDAGITRESLEAYLADKKGLADKEAVPCFWSGQGCTKHITPDEIRPCVSYDFFKTYMEGGRAPVVAELSDSIQNVAFKYLENTKTTTDGWGNVYHDTICPFCLVYEERHKGCAYMTHDNTKRKLPYSKSPYCLDANIVPEIINKYKEATTRLFTGERERQIEFCVECGRPCVGHQHFNLEDTPGLASHRVTIGPDRVPDYITCDGGGRPELFARILAMRKVLREYAGNDRTELRRLAAEAADKAPRDTELMAKAKAIFDMPIANRKWGNVAENGAEEAEQNAESVPEVESEAEAENNNAENDNAEINNIRQEHMFQDGGNLKRHPCPHCTTKPKLSHDTRKRKQKGKKLTRKHYS